ncbi:MAG: bifunctional diaminohydroxyphosphoribosylaminopyrimidine deaminase/5-amino-6-(5-phosphoribosylamino)uracil reductase RibD [Acetobacteraceae bacterium]
MTNREDDRAHMLAALALARRGLGQTWPNPPVGCVLVREGRVVGRGSTAPGGRPHAEAIALVAAGGATAAGATAYVTLEPCCHIGRAPPCTEALITAGVARVVMATRDPDPRVDGQGAARLNAAGIAVEEGLLAPEAEAVASGFLSRVRRGRPEVTLKLASTLDGRIATRSGESRWITGSAARHQAHALRGQSDAVLVGIGTVLADDPELTCRIPGFRARPVVRVVVDAELRIPPTARLVASASETPTWLLHRDDADPDRRRVLADRGARLFALPGSAAGVDPGAALAALGEAGLTLLLVEGGARLAAALIGAGLVDRLVWFHAPALLGADALAATAALGIDSLNHMPRFAPQRSRLIGDDSLSEFSRAGA